MDLFNRTIRLYAGETKGGDGRLVKLTNDVYLLLQACIAGKTTDDFVFTRKNGKPILDFRECWEKLTAAAGFPGLLFHDLRRSGVEHFDSPRNPRSCRNEDFRPQDTRCV